MADRRKRAWVWGVLLCMLLSCFAGSFSDAYKYRKTYVEADEEKCAVPIENSPLVTEGEDDPNYYDPDNSGYRTEKISKLAVHCMAGRNTGMECTKFLFNRPNASTNYCVGYDGDISVCVPEYKISWCTSNQNWDRTAVTIEVSNEPSDDCPFTQASYDALVKLCADICDRHEFEPSYKNYLGNKSWGTLSTDVSGLDTTIAEHNWWANKSCPGDYFHNKLESGDFVADVKAAMKGDYSSKDNKDGKDDKSNDRKGYDSKWFWGRNDLDVGEEDFLISKQNNLDESLKPIELTKKEESQLGLLRDSINQDKQEKPVDYIRIGVAIVGLAVCLYAVLLLLAHAFDTSNTITDTSLVHTLTFHKVYVMADTRNTKDSYHTKEGVQYLSRVKFFTSVACIFLLGILLLTGAVQMLFTWLADLLLSFI